MIIISKNPLCPVCERPSPYGLTHPICRKKLSLDGLYVFGDYRGILKNLLLAYKYKNVSVISKILYGLIINNLPNVFKKADLIIPIPLHPKRLMERGFNQSELLCRLIAGALDINVNCKSLVRKRHTLPQMSLRTYKERTKNIKNAFRVANPDSVKGKTVLLIDDIMTTGATMFEAVKTLKRNGAGKTYGIVVARKFSKTA